MSITENDLLEAIVAAESIPPFDPAIHVTVKMLADRLGVKLGLADRLLESYEKAGKLKVIEVRMPGGHRAKAGVKVSTDPQAMPAGERP